ncbi:MAG: N-acetyl-alpha-D-glucosaminyl L-malate synthase BshA [Chitinophagaceae bacterium]|nr:N-acetyl-alpha-D-glucosaminyl L-malate synthase BshA [Chitinophagaceae bacterium]
MKIGIVCYPTFGGSGVLATELGKALAQNGHQVHFITYKQPVRLHGFIPNIFFHEVHVPSYPLFEYPPYETALASAMVDVIKNSRLELLHVHYAIPHASAAYMAKQILRDEGIDIPVITTLHGTDITLVGRDKTFAPVVAFSINHSDVITAVSQNLKEETYRHFHIEKDIKVIYNFVDTGRFRKKTVDAFRKLIAPHDEKILIHASNFRKIKRVQDVVKIFSEVNRQIPAKLLFIGDGPERITAEDLARELDLCRDIRFLGKQDQIEEILPLGDLFILTSEYESFGLAALEAMAAGLPVISTNAGGLPEINIHGVTGFLADVGDTEAMARYAVNLLSDENELKKVKENVLAHAQKFDIRKIVPLYEETYREIIQGEVFSHSLKS